MRNVKQWKNQAKKKELTLEIEDPASFSSSRCLGFIARSLGAQELEVEDEVVASGRE